MRSEDKEMVSQMVSSSLMKTMFGVRIKPEKERNAAELEPKTHEAKANAKQNKSPWYPQTNLLPKVIIPLKCIRRSLGMYP